MRRIHIMLNVSSLEKAKLFYSKMLSSNPTKEKTDYLQWKIDNPGLNLSIKSSPAEAIGVNHLGIETDSDQDLEVLRASAQNANAEILDEGEVTCCYANSKKSWAKDADGMEWELFRSYSDSISYYESASLLK